MTINKRDAIEQLIDSHSKINSHIDLLSVVYDAMESTFGAIMITDNHGRIIYVNSSFLKMFGYENKNEIIEANTQSFFLKHSIQALSHFDEETLTEKDTPLEMNVLCKDGTEIFIEMTYSDVRNLSGAVIGRMASIRDVTKRKIAQLKNDALVQQLSEALANIKTLRGLIPICASCKKIRDDQGYWHLVESYIQKHSDAVFSHGLCPECYQSLYSDEPWFSNKNPLGDKSPKK